MAPMAPLTPRLIALTVLALVILLVILLRWAWGRLCEALDGMAALDTPPDRRPTRRRDSSPRS